MDKKDVDSHNEWAWDYAVEQEYRWSIPVDQLAIEKAKANDYNIKLSPGSFIPKKWLVDIRNKKLLGLAAGGGQQGPLLAGAGAKVTLLDVSSKQLAMDRKLSDEFGLDIQTIHGSVESYKIFQTNPLRIL